MQRERTSARHPERSSDRYGERLWTSKRARKEKRREEEGKRREGRGKRKRSNYPRSGFIHLVQKPYAREPPRMDDRR